MRSTSAGCSTFSSAVFLLRRWRRHSYIRELNTDVVAKYSAAATALEQSRGYYVAISSVGAQIRNPGTSDANMSKHAVNRLIEFIVLGSFASVFSFASFADSARRCCCCCCTQSIPECARLRLRPASSVRVCPLRLEPEYSPIKSRCPRRRHSISRPDARIGSLEGPWTSITCILRELTLAESPGTTLQIGTSQR